jgi:hypothetical protein
MMYFLGWVFFSVAAGMFAEIHRKRNGVGSHTMFKIKKLLVAASLALAVVSSPVHAGTQLQVQFQRWAYESNGLATLLVTLRNPTMKPFARVVWDCDLYDKEKRLVGRIALVFHRVPWGALVVDSQAVATNGQFDDGECRLVRAEEVTYENERLYRGSPKQLNVGLGMPVPMVNNYFNFDYRIQGRAKITTEEEDERLSALHKAGQLTGPGYR